MKSRDLDWEFPAYDMLTEEPTDPLDREHFSLLMNEIDEAETQREKAGSLNRMPPRTTVLDQIVPQASTAPLRVPPPT